MNSYEKYIVLFDEYGTATFKENSESDIFAGTSILYRAEDEQQIFDSLDEFLRFSRKKPLKNKDINNERAIRIANALCATNIQIVFKYLNLRDKNYQDVISNYELIGNFARKIVRGIRGRKISQILHHEILNNCIMGIIGNHLEHILQGRLQYEIFIDNLSIPNSDRHLSLNYGAESLQHHIQDLANKFDKIVKILIPEIQLLDTDSKRKRLIDAISSVFSRAFDKKHKQFSEDALKTLEQGFGNDFEYEDITIPETEFIARLTNEFAAQKF